MTASQQQTVVVEATGDLDFDTAPALEAAASTAFRSLDGVPDGRVIVDLSRVSFVDSAGLGVLVEIKRRSVEVDVPLTLTNVSRRLSRLFEVSGLLGVFDVESGAATSAG